jgi:hypothetical protein
MTLVPIPIIPERIPRFFGNPALGGSGAFGSHGGVDNAVPRGPAPIGGFFRRYALPELCLQNGAGAAERDDDCSLNRHRARTLSMISPR